jgi:hypothetical protein
MKETGKGRAEEDNGGVVEKEEDKKLFETAFVPSPLYTNTSLHMADFFMMILIGSA